MTTIETPLYTSDQLATINKNDIPAHIAVIPDGNRRWAKKYLLMPEEGHRKGAKQLLDFIEASAELGIKTITFYVFSTENWARPQREIKAQLWLLEKSLDQQRERMVANGVRFRTIGNLSPFPQKIIDKINQTVEDTAKGESIDVVFALNYGGRDDICRGVRKLFDSYKNGNLELESITEDLLSKHLDTSEWPDPDLLIRTSGEQRVSNFLLWQLSYTEFYLTDTLWPDFTPNHLVDAIKSYQKRERRLGGS